MQINHYIDYTALKPDIWVSEIENLCNTAIEQQYYAVCVSPCYVELAKSHLQNTSVKICTVVGFPSGMNLLQTKMQEAEILCTQGADELDMVINISKLKNRDTSYLETEIQTFSEFCRQQNIVSKLILETGLLSVEELRYICDICNDFPLNFAKTSTGFNGKGAELEKVRLMREVLRSDILIKASGGIRDYETACAFIAAGANRIGTSAKILTP